MPFIQFIQKCLFWKSFQKYPSLLKCASSFTFLQSHHLEPVGSESACGLACSYAFWMGSIFSRSLSDVEKNQLTQSDASEAYTVTLLIEHLGRTYFVCLEPSVCHSKVPNNGVTVIKEFSKVDLHMLILVTYMELWGGLKCCILPIFYLYELFVLGINMSSLFWVNFTIFWLLCGID